MASYKQQQQQPAGPDWVRDLAADLFARTAGQAARSAEHYAAEAVRLARAFAAAWDARPQQTTTPEPEPAPLG